MSKIIKYVERILDIDKHPIKSQVEDDGGALQWEVEPDMSAPEGSIARAGKPKFRDTTTYDLLKEITRGLANVPSIHKPDDERRIAGIRNAVDAAEELKDKAGGIPDVELGDKSYAWFHEVMKRPVAMSYRDTDVRKEAKERGEEATIPYIWILFKNNASIVQVALSTDEDKDKAGPLIN